MSDVATVAVDATEGPFLFLEVSFVPATFDAWEEKEKRREGLEVTERLCDKSRDNERCERVRSGRLKCLLSPGSKELIASNMFFDRKAAEASLEVSR